MEEGPVAGVPRVVLFDVDGTLVDSEQEGHRVAFNRAFAAHGLPYRWDRAVYRRLLEVTGGERRLRYFLERVGWAAPDAARQAAALHTTKTALFRRMIDAGEIPPRPGVQRLLDELTAAGVRLGVVTTGTRSWVAPLLAGLFGADRFEVIITGDEVAERKPAPDAYQAALARLAEDPEDIVAVEDSPSGVASAVAAGIPCLQVLNSETTPCSAARLVVDGFGTEGHPARVVLGDPDALEDGRVTSATLRSVLAAHATRRGDV